LFAATILNASEKQESRRNLFIESPPRNKRNGGYRDDERAPLSSFRRNKPNSGTEGPSRTCYRFLSLLSLAALVIVLLVAMGLVYFGKGNRDRMDALVTLLSNGGISDLELLTKRGTPQHTAANWLANLDPLEVEFPSTPLDASEHWGLIQRYSLAVVFFALCGDTQWTNSLKFTSELHECSWFHPVPDEAGEVYAVGVTCDTDLRVTNLLIPGNRAEGIIPDELSNLSDLNFLSLKHNSIGGSLPSSLAKLTKLDYFDLKFNELTGTMPEFLGTSMTDLQVLGLSNNQFHGSLPTSFTSLQKLRTLAVGENHLTGDLFPVATLTNLEYLYADNNLFDSHLDRNVLGRDNKAMLDDLTQLIELDLSENQLRAFEIPSKLFNMPFLTALDLSHNRIRGPLPVDMDSNVVLEFLSLRGNFISGAMTNKLTNLEALIHLDLEDNELSGVVSAMLFKGLTRINNLFLGKNPFDAWSIPGTMADMLSIKELSLDNANLIGSIPSFVFSEAWKKLKVLDLHNNTLTGSLPLLGQWSQSRLSVLLLNDNKLMGAIPTELTDLPELTAVALHHNGFITDVGGLCRTGDDVIAPGPLELLTTDCANVTCTCCKECCDAPDCYSNVDWDDFGFSKTTWDEHFQRADYSFNPHIVATSEQNTR
jgi:Leucine-rich repeat (LRR) protein